MRSLPLTTTSLTASPNPQTIGQPITFTATVQPSSGSTPTGTVGFSYQGLLANGTPYAQGPWNNVAMDGAGEAKFTTASIPSGSISVVAYYLGDPKNSPSSASMIETVSQIPTTTTITANTSSAPYDTPVTFTATVLETGSGKPAQGSISFNIGNTSYDSAVLNSAGQATWTSGTEYSILPAGADQVAASFTTLKGAVDQDSQGSVTVNVTGGPPDFTMAANPTSLSVSAGHTVTTAISINALHGFSQSVTFFCSDLPWGATCAFSPAAVTGAGSTMLSISAPASSASSNRPTFTTLVLALLIGCLPLRRGRIGGAYWLITIGTITCLSLSACGGSSANKSGSPGSPSSNSYTVTVQATSESLVHAVQLNLTVNQP
jgi:hypothetical protein